MKNKNLAIITNGKRVATSSNNRANFVRLESFDNANPFFVFVVPYP
jgi:hypothetical protein